MSNDEVSMGQRMDGENPRESASDRGSHCDVDNENRDFRLLMMRSGRLAACTMPGG